MQVVLGVAPGGSRTGPLLVGGGAVGQDDAREAPGARGGEHRTGGEAVVHQAGTYPRWSMWAWVSTTVHERRRVDRQWAQLRSRRCFGPWYKPAVHQGATPVGLAIRCFSR